MKHEERRASPGIEDPMIQAHFLPGGQLLRLALGQFRFHGEIGLGKIQTIFKIHLVGAKAFLPAKMPETSRSRLNWLRF